jgi:hypothetical protein
MGGILLVFVLGVSILWIPWHMTDGSVGSMESNDHRAARGVSGDHLTAPFQQLVFALI